MNGAWVATIEVITLEDIIGDLDDWDIAAYEFKELIKHCGQERIAVSNKNLSDYLHSIDAEDDEWLVSFNLPSPNPI